MDEAYESARQKAQADEYERMRPRGPSEPSYVDEKACERALIRLKTDPFILEAIEIEPELAKIIEDAKTHYFAREPDYSRFNVYDSLKSRVVPLVGDYAREPRLQTKLHYEAFIQLIDEILPFNSSEEPSRNYSDDE